MKFNVSTSIISVVDLLVETEEEALKLVQEGKVDVIKDAVSIENVTINNGIEQIDVYVAK